MRNAMMSFFDIGVLFDLHRTCIDQEIKYIHPIPAYIKKTTAIFIAHQSPVPWLITSHVRSIGPQKEAVLAD
jgi:hypothetical protein